MFYENILGLRFFAVSAEIGLFILSPAWKKTEVYFMFLMFV